MDCAELTHDRLISFLDHTLLREESLAVRAHLQGCDACRRRQEDVRAIVLGLRAVNEATKAHVPQAVEDALLVEFERIATAAREQRLEPSAELEAAVEARSYADPADGAALSWSRRQVVGSLAAAALFLTALIGGLTNWLGDTGEDEGTPLAGVPVRIAEEVPSTASTEVRETDPTDRKGSAAKLGVAGGDTGEALDGGTIAGLGGGPATTSGTAERGEAAAAATAAAGEGIGSDRKPAEGIVTIDGRGTAGDPAVGRPADVEKGLDARGRDGGDRNAAGGTDGRSGVAELDTPSGPLYGESAMRRGRSAGGRASGGHAAGVRAADGLAAGAKLRFPEDRIDTRPWSTPLGSGSRRSPAESGTGLLAGGSPTDSPEGVAAAESAAGAGARTVPAEPSFRTAPPTVAQGDVNGDGRVDIADSMLITRALLRADPGIDLSHADANGDGKVDIADSMHISSQVVGGAQ